MLQIVASLIDDARVVIYYPSLSQDHNYSFIVLVTVMVIVNYEHTVITIIYYGCKTFMIQTPDYTSPIAYTKRPG
jgi:hypothetical protein